MLILAVSFMVDIWFYHKRRIHHLSRLYVMHDARRKNNVNRLDVRPVRHNHGVFASCIVYDLGGTYSKMERE